jgi:molybdenum cofactor cytidylyltransferase
MVSAVLLAAGSSRRMGALNKLLLPFGDRTIVASTAAELVAAHIGEIIVVTGHEETKVEAALAGLPVRLAHNPDYESGLTGSIQTGVRHARGNGYMICLADMVLITHDEYALLNTAFDRQHLLDDRCILVPAFAGRKGNPVIFSSWYRDAILRHPEKEGCKSLVQEHSAHRHILPMPTGHVLQDIDLPDDYQRLTRQD